MAKTNSTITAVIYSSRVWLSDSVVGSDKNGVAGPKPTTPLRIRALSASVALLQFRQLRPASSNAIEDKRAFFSDKNSNRFTASCTRGRIRNYIVLPSVMNLVVAEPPKTGDLLERVRWPAFVQPRYLFGG